MNVSRRVWLAAIVVVVAVLAVLPQLDDVAPGLANNSRLFTMTQMFMALTIASSWNLTGGFTGYVDFGHAVFFGIGAYGTGIVMTKLDWPFIPALLAGAAAAALFAVFIGAATLRLKGPYFSIAMLGTFVAMREIVRVWRPLTGGGSGLNMPLILNRPLFYYVTLAVLVAFVAVVWWIRRSQFGASLVAIREDEIGAEMRGINTTVTKSTIFTIAAFVTGIVGGLWARQNSYLSAGIVFVETRTVDAVMMALLGGLGTVAGPVIGGALLFWLRDIVWASFLDYHLIVQGGLLILIVLYVPEGILGRLSRQSGAVSLGRVWRRAASDPSLTGSPGEVGSAAGARLDSERTERVGVGE
jgi:branched-chain amino acid transport system permease protein